MLSSNRIERTGFALFVCVALAPIGISLLYALGYSTGVVGLLSEGFTLRYWSRLGASGEIWWSFGMSIAIAAVVTALSVGLAILLGVPLRRELRRGWLSYMIHLPLALPGMVLAFVVFHLLSGAGILARVMAGFGLIDDPSGFPNLVNDPYGLGIIIAEVAVGVPFFMILFAQLYESERLHELSRLAETLGADRRGSLRRIVVPVLLRRAFPTILLSAIAVLGAYEVPLLLGPQWPQMVSVLTMRKYAMFDLAQKPEAFICALLYTCVSAAVIAFAYRRAGRREE